ncbi:MAG: hypothetical protein U0746_00455 [Gemmataceae bacterium]
MSRCRMPVHAIAEGSSTRFLAGAEYLLKMLKAMAESRAPLEGKSASAAVCERGAASSQVIGGQRRQPVALVKVKSVPNPYDFARRTAAWNPSVMERCAPNHGIRG